MNETLEVFGKEYSNVAGIKATDSNGNILTYTLTGGAVINNQNKTVDPSTSQQTVTADSGYTGLGTVTVSAMPSGTAGTPLLNRGTVTDHSITLYPYVNNTAGYISGGTKTGATTRISASDLVSDTKSITSNGTGIDVTNYASVNVSVPSGSPTLQSKTKSYTPSEIAQSETVSADSGYDGLSSVDISVSAISSTYVGSGITRRSSSDLTASGPDITVPAGYYSSNATKSVTTATHAQPSVSIDASGLITATHVAPSAYMTGGTTSKTLQLTTQGATTITPTKSSQTAVTAGKYTTGAITVAAIPANYIDTTDANAAAGDIVSGKTAYVNGSKVTGTLTFSNIYTGSADPSSSTGSNGDIYLKVVS